MRARITRAGLGAAIVTVVLLCAAVGTFAKEVPSPWTWTDYGSALRDVSCASPGVCVAVGQRAVSLHSTEHTDVPLAWSKGFLTYQDELTGVTCNQTFCLAVSNTRTLEDTFVSKVYRSTDHGEKWSDGVALGEAGPIKTRSAVAVACDPAAGRPSRRGAGACYAVGPAGGVWRSTDEGFKWEPLDLPSTPAEYHRVACPEKDTCVAVGGNKEEVGSSAVIKGTKVTPVKVPEEAGVLEGLGCDTATRCTATDTLGHYMSLSIPDETWGPAKSFPYPVTKKHVRVTALACPKENVCIGVEYHEPEVMTTTSLSTDSWEPRPVATRNLDAIACADTTCIAVGRSAAWFASLNAGEDWARVNEVAPFDAIQCSADLSPMCVAGGKKDLGVSRSRGELWSLPLNGRTGLDVKSVNCTGSSECLVLGKNLSLYTKDLRSFFPRQPASTAPAGTDALTCMTDDACVAVGEGVVYTTLDRALTSWIQNAFVPEMPTSVACVARSTDQATCVVTTAKHIVRGTMSKSAEGIIWDWKYAHLDSAPEKLAAVGCSPGGQCTAVGPGGEIFVSAGTDLLHWTKHVVPEGLPEADRPRLDGVACPANGVCLAGGIHGQDGIIVSTRDNWTDYSYDKIKGIDLQGVEPTISGFGCESVDRCVAVGSTALVGVAHSARRRA